MKKLILLTLAVPMVLVACQKAPEVLDSETVPAALTQTQSVPPETPSIEAQTGSSTGSSSGSNIQDSGENNFLKNEKGIGNVFEDGEIKVNLFSEYNIGYYTNDKKMIHFGPLVVGYPDGRGDDKAPIYSITFRKALPRDKTLERIQKEDGETMGLKAAFSKIGKLDVVKWTSGGYCDGQNMEVLGTKHNYLFYSLGCYEGKEEDFAYFEKVIKTLEIKTSDSGSVLFSDAQVKDILAKIDENSKQKTNVNTGVLVDGKYKAEFIPSKDNTDDKIKITIDGKETISSFVYNIQNQQYQTNNEQGDFEKFHHFDSFSPSKYYLLYTTEVSGYGSSSRYLIDVKIGKTILELENSTFGIWSSDNKRFISNKIFGGLIVTKKGQSPEIDTIGGTWSFTAAFADENYLYGVGFASMSEPQKFLKIYDLGTLKEVFSKEIK